MRTEIENNYKKKILEKYDNGINHIKNDKYIFVSKEYQWIIPFTYKKAKNSNSPLFIYICGSGSMGSKNILNMLEVKGKNILNKIKNYDTNILLPQFEYNNEYIDKVERFTDLLYKLINQIEEIFPIDKSRIYIVGNSLGGYVVWKSLMKYSNIYAGAVSVVGAVDNYQCITQRELNNIASVPLWIAHSTNDKCVSIKSDDYIANKLTKMGTPPIYTRWYKYGHSMSNIFYTRENWQDWLFKQKKN